MMSFRIGLMIISLFPFLLFAGEFYFCKVEVYNEKPLERGFVTSFLTGEITRILLETGWVQDCERGKNIRVSVKDATFEGSSISGNRFSGYDFKLTFTLHLPERDFTYTLTKYIALPDPSKGTLAVRSALVDVFDAYSLRIKTDLLDYMRRHN